MNDERTNDLVMARALAETKAAAAQTPGPMDIWAGKVEGVDYLLVDGRPMSKGLAERVLARRAG